MRSRCWLGTVALLALCTISGQSLQAAQVFYDGFEYADPPTSHGWLIKPFGDLQSIYTTGARAHTGERSLVMDSLDDQEQRLTYPFGQALTDACLVVWMFDDMVTAHGLVAPLWGPCQAYMGIRGPTSATHYTTETCSLGSWQATSVPRTFGWHKLTFCVSPAGLDYYIDDAFVRHSNVTTWMEWCPYDCGDWGLAVVAVGPVGTEGNA